MHKPEDLEIHVVSTETITCDECGETIEEYMLDTDALFNLGWRATRTNRVYCPMCAKTKVRK